MESNPISDKDLIFYDQLYLKILLMEIEEEINNKKENKD